MLDQRQKAKILERLEKEKLDIAVASMNLPKSTEFERGIQIGIYRGIDKAINRFNEMLKEENKDDESQR